MSSFSASRVSSKKVEETKFNYKFRSLQNALKESEDSHFRQRVLMLLLMNDGKTYAEITEFLGCSYRSVAYWCCHGDPDDLESLKDQRKKGKKQNNLNCFKMAPIVNPNIMDYIFSILFCRQIATGHILIGEINTVNL